MANVPDLPPGEYGGYVPITDALPGWSAYWGDSPLTQVVHNNWTFGSQAIWLWGPGFPGSRLEGDFEVTLVPGGDAVSLSQVGLIPAGTQSIRFRGLTDYPARADTDRFALYLDGQNVPIVTVVTTPDYVLLGGDVSRFAGAEAELKFTAYWLDETPNALRLDAITFSTEPIPEPSVVTLLGFGGVWLIRRLLLRKRT